MNYELVSVLGFCAITAALWIVGPWRGKITVSHAFLWSFLLLGMPLVPIVWDMYQMMYGAWYGALLLCSAAMLLVVGTAAVVWYMLCRWCSACIRSSVLRAYCVMVLAWVWWLYVDYCALLPVGMNGGIPLVSPLVSLATIPWVLWTVAWCGRSCALLIYLLFIALCARVLVYRTFGESIALGMCIVVGTASMLMPQRRSMHYDDMCAMGVLDVICQSRASSSDVNTVLYCAWQTLPHDSCEIVCTPESSIYAINMGIERDQACGAFEALKSIKNCFIAGFRSDGVGAYNTVWWFKNGEMTEYFDKRTLILGFEYLPEWLRNSQLQVLCMGALPPLSKGVASRPCWEVFPGCSCVPYLCIELFLRPSLDDTYDSSVAIVAICNTRWAGAALQRRMEAYLRLQACAWNRWIYYVANHKGILFSPAGQAWPLPCSDHVVACKKA